MIPLSEGSSPVKSCGLKSACGREHGLSLCGLLPERTQQRAIAIAGVNRHLDRKTDAQGMIGRRRLVENDLHRQALHDLDPIPGGILWWQQGECSAGACA